MQKRLQPFSSFLVFLIAARTLNTWILCINSFSFSFSFSVQSKEHLDPASSCKRHLIVRELDHATSTPGCPVWRGPATSVRESSEHVLVQQPVQETGQQ